MDRRLSMSSFVAASAFVALALPAFAQQSSAPQMFVVHAERVMPAKLAAYEATSKEFLATLRDHRAVMPLLSFTALQGEDLSYSYIAPIRGLADVEAINASFEAMGKAVGEQRWGDLMRRNGETMEGIDEAVFAEVPGASYWPAGAKTTSQNAAYYQLDFYHVMPGMEDGAGQVAMAWKALFEGAKVPYGYSVFRLALGDDGPLWVVSVPARDPADLAMIQQASRQAIGEAAWKAQTMKALAITRRFDSKRYWVRPDLSLAPASAATPAGR